MQVIPSRIFVWTRTRLTNVLYIGESAARLIEVHGHFDLPAVDDAITPETSNCVVKKLMCPL